MSENYDGDMESCIGHELAHAWLGHGLNQLPPEAERAADALAGVGLRAAPRDDLMGCNRVAIAEFLNRNGPGNRGHFVSSLVAGVGFEPTTFGL